jgi:hypothetical protein
MDTCHFVVEDVSEITIFNKTDCFNKFVTTYATRRTNSTKEGNEGYGKYCKMIMNSSYGYDIPNEANFSNNKLCTFKQAMMSQARPNFLGTRQINDELYNVAYKSTKFQCNTCIQSGFYTLDNAKFAYMMLYYGFLNVCLDMNKVHFVEGDTDSMYLAVGGNPEKGVHQGFEYVVKDREFYDKYFYKWYPDPSKGKEDEKKLGGVAIEKEGNVMIAIAPKNYYIQTEERPVMKAKGCSLGRNKQITPDDYIKNIKYDIPVNATNCGFRERKEVLVKEIVEKTAISGVHTKMIVLKNDACAPYIYELKASDYSVEK